MFGPVGHFTVCRNPSEITAHKFWSCSDDLRARSAAAAPGVLLPPCGQKDFTAAVHLLLALITALDCVRYCSCYLLKCTNILYICFFYRDFSVYVDFPWMDGWIFVKFSID